MRAVVSLGLKGALAGMREALLSRTGKNTQIVFVGEAASAVLGFLLNIVLIRGLTVNEYGLFSLYSATLMLLAGFMHLGWGETYVRFGPRHLGHSQFEALRGHVFRRMMGGATFFALLASQSSRWISDQVYHRPEFGPYVGMAAAGAWIACLFSFFQNDARVRQNMNRFVVGRVGSSALRLFVCGAAVSVGAFTLFEAAAAYMFAPLAFVAIPLFRDLASGRLMASRPPSAALRDELASYTGWIFLSMFTTNLIGNIDAHVLAYFHSNETLSAFSAAGRLTLPIQMVILSLTTTLLPRLSAARDQSEIRYYLSKVWLFLAPLAALTLAAVFLAPPVLVWIAGDAYAGITTLLRLQILVTLVVLLTNPMGLVLYSWGWSRLLAMMNVFQLLVDVALDLLWIPRWGAIGAVGATLVVNLIGMVTVYVALWYGLKKRSS